MCKENLEKLLKHHLPKDALVDIHAVIVVGVVNMTFFMFSATYESIACFIHVVRCHHHRCE